MWARRYLPRDRFQPQIINVMSWQALGPMKDLGVVRATVTNRFLIGAGRTGEMRCDGLCLCRSSVVDNRSSQVVRVCRRAKPRTASEPRNRSRSRLFTIQSTAQVLFVRWAPPPVTCPVPRVPAHPAICFFCLEAGQFDRQAFMRPSILPSLSVFIPRVSFHSFFPPSLPQPPPNRLVSLNVRDRPTCSSQTDVAFPSRLSPICHFHLFFTPFRCSRWYASTPVKYQYPRESSQPVFSLPLPPTDHTSCRPALLHPPLLSAAAEHAIVGLKTPSPSWGSTPRDRSYPLPRSPLSIPATALRAQI